MCHLYVQDMRKQGFCCKNVFEKYLCIPNLQLMGFLNDTFALSDVAWYYKNLVHQSNDEKIQTMAQLYV